MTLWSAEEAALAVEQHKHAVRLVYEVGRARPSGELDADPWPQDPFCHMCGWWHDWLRRYDHPALRLAGCPHCPAAS